MRAISIITSLASFVNQPSLSSATAASTMSTLMSPGNATASTSQGGRGPKKEGKKTRHYVFGYGSLMCPESRSITNPDLIHSVSLPVVIRDVERVWSARTTSGYTAMGVRFQPDAECTGVLIELTDEQQLADLDKREAAYNRLPIELDNIDQVPFLDEEEFYDEDHPVLNDTSDGKHVKVWVYMQKEPIYADPSHPIPQSYVDIIIRGCLTISEEFAQSFIETTAGWNNEEINWVDDREVPIYRRADSEYSTNNAEAIDNILEKHTPNALEERAQYDPVDHLEALADALEEDLAHPRAIKHIVKRVRDVAEAGNPED